VSGVSCSGGLGWADNRNHQEAGECLRRPSAVIVIGLIAEGLLFRTLTSPTVERWGGAGAGLRTRLPLPDDLADGNLLRQQAVLVETLGRGLLARDDIG
jgi:hypothetical protein